MRRGCNKLTVLGLLILGLGSPWHGPQNARPLLSVDEVAAAGVK